MIWVSLCTTGRHCTGWDIFSLALRTFPLSLPDCSPLPDGSPAHRACSDTNGLRQKAQRQHMGLVLTHNVGLFNVIFNNVVTTFQTNTSPQCHCTGHRLVGLHSFHPASSNSRLQ